MQIALYTDSFFPELGGIQDSVATLARELGRRGHRVLVIAPAAATGDFAVAGLAPAELDLGPRVAIARGPALPLPGSTGQSRLFVPTPPTWRAIAGFRPDVVHLHTFLSAGWTGARHAALLGVPLIGTNHWAVDAFGDYAPARLAAPALRAGSRLVNRFYRRCRIVTTPSRATARQMRRAGFAGELRVISNPIDTLRFSPHLAPPAADHHVVYAGRLAIEKKIDVLIDAFARVAATRPRITLTIAGHGNDRARLLARAAASPAADRIRFVATLDHDALAALLRSATVFATASTSETQCMALLQAMACAVPAVVVASRALPEVVGAAAGLIAKPDDTADFAAQLAQLVDDASLHRRLAAGALARARASAVARVIERWEALYAGVI
ncbi:MAG: glycosyltransferase [Lautropia sp.]